MDAGHGLNRIKLFEQENEIYFDSYKNFCFIFGRRHTYLVNYVPIFMQTFLYSLMDSYFILSISFHELSLQYFRFL